MTTNDRLPSAGLARRQATGDRSPSHHLGHDSAVARLMVVLDDHVVRQGADPEVLLIRQSSVTGHEAAELRTADILAVVAELHALRGERAETGRTIQKLTAQRDSAEQVIRSAHAALESLRSRDGYRA